MQVIRIEHTDGLGPFQESKWVEEINDFEKEFSRKDYTVDNILPEMYKRHGAFRCPWVDNICNFKVGKHFCGYKSIDQLQQWVKKEEFEVLFANDYNIYLLEVSEAIEGFDQIVFKKEHIISKTNISNLFK